MAAPKLEETSVSRQLTAANEEAWMTLGRIAEMMGDDENTMIAYEKVLVHNRTNPVALFAIGTCYEKLEDYSKAADCFRGLVSLNEGNSDAWGHLGYCCLMLNDLTSAHTAYQYAMYNNPMSQKDPDMWYGIGQLYERLGTLDHAQESFEAVLRFEPTFNMALEVKFRLGIIAKQRGDYEGALERLKSVLHDVQSNMQANDMTSDIWTQIGHVYELKDEIQLAKTSYQKVAEINPNNAKPFQQLGWLCLKHSDHGAAIDFLKKAVAIDPEDGKGWYLLGRCYMAVHEFEEAYDSYKHAVTTDSQNPNVWCSLGVLFYQLNQHLDALDAYSRAININPNICEVWYNVGTLYDTCNQTSDARDAYQKAAELGADAQFIRERLDLLRARENGQSTTGMPGANSAPGPSEPPTTSPMPTFTSRPTPENAANAGVNQGPHPNGSGSVAPQSSGQPGSGAPMSHMIRVSEGQGGPVNGGMPGTVDPSGRSGPPMMRPLPGGPSGHHPMNGNGGLSRGIMGGMPGMQSVHPSQQQGVPPGPHPPIAAYGQPVHVQQSSQPHQSHIQLVHQQPHGVMQRQGTPGNDPSPGSHLMPPNSQRSLPGRGNIKEEGKGGIRYAMEGDRKMHTPNRWTMNPPKNLSGPGGPPGPQPSRRDRFPPMGSDPKLSHPSLPPPTGRR